ncbi:MAG TPA: hypothetical protein V6D07_18650 [Trichocoleus sp.]
MPEVLLPEDFNPFEFTVRTAGHFYKGGKKIPYKDNWGNDKERVGANLGNSGLRFHSEDPRAVQLFKRFYGAKLQKREDGLLVVPEVNIYLPFESINHNYVVGYGQYKQGGGFQHLCTGTTIIREKVKKSYKNSKGEEFFSWPVEQVKKPCPAAGSSQKCTDCQYIRRLTFYIAELYDEGFKRAFTLNTPAANESQLLFDLKEYLRQIKALGGDNVSSLPVAVAASPETSFFIRWKLTRAPEMIGVPMTEKRGGKTVQTGQQTQKEEWLLHIEPEQAWWDTIMERMGKGAYRIDRETGRAICMADERLKYLQGMATAAQQMAVAGATINHYLPGAIAQIGQPQLEGEVEVLDATITGVSLNGDQPLDVEIQEVLGVEDAPFNPKSPNPANINRFRQVARLMTLEDTAIAQAIRACYEGRHSSELREVHCRKVIDHMLIDWAMQQAKGDEPLFPSKDAAEAFMLSQKLPREDVKRTQWWIQRVVLLQEGGEL